MHAPTTGQYATARMQRLNITCLIIVWLYLFCLNVTYQGKARTEDTLNVAEVKVNALHKLQSVQCL